MTTPSQPNQTLALKFQLMLWCIKIPISDAAVQADLSVNYQKTKHVKETLCPDNFFLPAVEAVQALPGYNFVELDGALDKECDDKPDRALAQVQHQ